MTSTLPITRRIQTDSGWGITLDTHSNTSRQPFSPYSGSITHNNKVVGKYHEDRSGGPTFFCFTTHKEADAFHSHAKNTLDANRLIYSRRPEEEYVILMIREHIARVGVTSAHKSGRLVYAVPDELTPANHRKDAIWHEVSLPASYSIIATTPAGARSIAKRVHARGVSLAGKLVWDGEQWVDFDSLS